MDHKAKPFIKYAGGKTRLLHEIRKLVPDSFGTYHEPFVGGGAVFFDLLPKKAILSDVNAKLINCYHALTKSPESVIQQLSTFLYEEKFYYKMRLENFSVGSSAYRAASFIYCNKTGFNGLYRENAKGQFNIPFGKYVNPLICDDLNLWAVSKALQGVEIYAQSYRNVECAAVAGDFVFCDPPYVPVSATANFVGYAAGGFGLAEQIELRDMALRMKRKGVHMVLCNADVPTVRELYGAPGDFTLHHVEVGRSINSKGSARGKVGEVLIT